MEHTIKIYPVRNEDCILIKLGNGITIIIDCQIKTDLTDDRGKQVLYDVKKDLLDELSKDNEGRPLFQRLNNCTFFLVLVLWIILFIFAYRKQTKFIKERIECSTNKKIEQ